MSAISGSPVALSWAKVSTEERSNTNNNKSFFILKKEISKKENGDIYYELHKIGVNINQIARAINTDIDKFINQDFAEDFINLFEEITNDIEKIKGKI